MKGHLHARLSLPAHCQSFMQRHLLSQPMPEPTSGLGLFSFSSPFSILLSSSSKLPAVQVLRLVSKSPIFSLWSSSAIPRLASGRLRTSTHPGLRAHIISPRGRTKGTLPYLPHYSLNRGWEYSVWDLCTTFSRAPPREPVKQSGRRHVRSSKRERER